MDYIYNLKTKFVMCSFSIKVLYAKIKPTAKLFKIE